MNSDITTLDPILTAHNAKSILSKDGFKGFLLELAPGDETTLAASSDGEHHVLFVVQGQVTVRSAEINTILDQDEALLTTKDKDYVISAHPGGRAKVLRLDVPPRQVVTPPILTFER